MDESLLADARQIEALFDAVVALPVERRAAFLAEACPQDLALRHKVQRLLDQDASSGKLLDSPIVIPQQFAMGSPAGVPREPDSSAMPVEEVLSAEIAAASVGLVPGQRLGGYEIIRPLGAGGMGAVYEARQRRPERTVALKVMNPALTSSRALKRFEYEAEILARLQHPGIAQVYAAGVAEEGVFRIPYFAMELVPDAAALTKYAARHSLDLPTRLHLFLQVCAAVHHGHLSGVIHRDLKPANILVPDPPEGSSRTKSSHVSMASASRTGRSSDALGLPQPKVIDFGVARLHEGEWAGAESHTQTGDVVGTPAYMSPEQARADGSPIDARADVYALSVILFELLTGQRPFPEGGGARACLERILRDEPIRPSTLNRSIDDELECVLLKGLRKDPVERYQSVDQFAADVRRYLAGEPIEAKRGSTMYLFRKTIRRYRVPIAVLATIVLTLGTALAVSLSLWKQAVVARTSAEDARKTAEEQKSLAEKAARQQEVEAEKANQSFGFLRDVLIQEELFKKQEHDRDVLKRVLADAGRRVEDQPDMDPDVQARIMLFIFQAYQALDAHEEALVWGKRFLEKRSLVEPSEDAEGFIFALVQDVITLRAGAIAGSDEVFRQRYADAQARFGPEALPTLLARTFLSGSLLMLGCQYREAEQVIDDFVPTCDRALGRLHFVSRGALDMLVAYRISQGRYEDALAHANEALARVREAEPENVGSQLNYEASLAEVHLRSGNLEEAESMYRDVWNRANAGQGDDALFVVNCAFGLSEALLQLDRLPEAEEMLLQVHNKRLELLGSAHPETAQAESRLGELRYRQGDLAQAAVHLTEALRVFRLQFEECNTSIIEATISLARVTAAQGQREAAIELLLASRNGITADDAPSQLLREELNNALAELGLPEP